MVSLVAEKVWVEWPYIFSTLETLGSGKVFISWVKLLYNDLLSTVLTNGRRLHYFHLGPGKRQVCPCPPLLFASAIEPLAKAIKYTSSITDVSVRSKSHKISLYADDVLLFLTNLKYFMYFRCFQFCSQEK